MQLRPECRVAIAKCRRGAYRRVGVNLAAAQGGGGIGEAKGNVLHQDVEVVLALPITQLLVILGRLSVHEVGLQSIPVALQERVRERAVAPPDTVPVQVNEENRERIEESPRKLPRRCRTRGAEEAAVLDAAAQIVGDDEAFAIAAINSADRRDGRHSCRLKAAENRKLALHQWRGEFLNGEQATSDAHEAHQVARWAHFEGHQLDLGARPVAQRLRPWERNQRRLWAA